MFSGMINRIKEYLKVKAEQIKLRVIGHVARLMSHVIVLAFLGLLGFFLLFFLSFALSTYLNTVLESPYWGFLVVAGGYFFFFLVIAILAKTGKIQQWLEVLILKISDQIEEDEDE